MLFYCSLNLLLDFQEVDLYFTITSFSGFFCEVSHFYCDVICPLLIHKEVLYFWTQSFVSSVNFKCFLSVCGLEVFFSVLRKLDSVKTSGVCMFVLFHLTAVCHGHHMSRWHFHVPWDLCRHCSWGWIDFSHWLVFVGLLAASRTRVTLDWSL